MKRLLLSFVSGLVFAVGLGLSGMTLPAKVLGFLDLTGAWDPSLALVMGSGLLVLAVTHRLAPTRPVLAEEFARLPSRRVDGRLVGGAALFGVGWGLAGYCPGPGLVALGAGSAPAALFVLAMVGGMLLYGLFERWSPEPDLAASLPLPSGVTSVARESCG